MISYLFTILEDFFMENVENPNRKETNFCSSVLTWIEIQVSCTRKLNNAQKDLFKFWQREYVE